jgi:hypothetical protein
MMYRQRTRARRTPGQTATATITVTPVNGFIALVSFNCSGVLPGTSCSFSPSTVTPSGASGISDSDSNRRYNCKESASHFIWIHARCRPRAHLVHCHRQKSPLVLSLGLYVAVTVSLFCLGACSSGTSNGGTTSIPESGTVTITAISGLLSHSAPLSVSVN